jgi:hypothetical protein
MTPEGRARKLPVFEAGGFYNAAKKRGLLPRRGLRDLLAAFLGRNRGGSTKRQR